MFPRRRRSAFPRRRQFTFPKGRLTPDRSLVQSPESEYDVMDDHSFRLKPPPTWKCWPTRHLTQEWGGNCWDIPTDPCTPTYPRTGPTNARLYRLDRRTTSITTPTDDSDNGCRQYPIEGIPVEQIHTISDWPSGRTHITDSLSGVAADVRLSQGTRLADGVSESPPDIPVPNTDI